ncbi:O-acetyl-ADP-ribose deacetylase [Ligilactobacillus faecis]|uniref:O-acetyl-ADP-ribose deacetylase n=1 Tax=Ligilactobacillus faecis TaxID=762833 RepID=UPI002469B7CB|nr:O-acetyl-ADP-ribose deacetylase [Ligilactobacillus faecis]WGN88918.1 O-acetyl-ADP-ribose deacetylase [Ligilactobacillus faecis]
MLKLVLGDLTKEAAKVEAIVNAANPTLLGGGGVDGAIHRAAGPKLKAECQKLHGCAVGEAKLTKAYALPCNYVIHTVGPRFQGGHKREAELLAACYTNTLILAQQTGIRTLAFPSIATGVYRFPVELAAKIAVRTVKNYLVQEPTAFDVVEWVLFDENTYKAYEKVLK